MAIHNEVGKLGEDLAAEFLLKRGFAILDRNYRKRYGEIDIVCRKGQGMYRFIEVKSVSWETRKPVPHGTYRPEDNVHARKVNRLRNVIQAYLFSKGLEEADWQFDILAVYLDRKMHNAKMRHIENIILGS